MSVCQQRLHEGVMLKRGCGPLEGYWLISASQQVQHAATFSLSGSDIGDSCYASSQFCKSAMRK